MTPKNNTPKERAENLKKNYGKNLALRIAKEGVINCMYEPGLKNYWEQVVHQLGEVK